MRPEATLATDKTRIVLVLKALGVAASVALLAVVLGRADWAGAAARLGEVGPAVLLVLIPFPFALLCDATAWQKLLAKTGAEVRLSRLFRVRVATEAVTIALPAGGLAAEGLAPFLVAPDAPIASSLAASATKRWLIIRTHGYYVALAAVLGFGTLAAASRVLVRSGALPWIVLASGAALVGLSIFLEAATTRLGIAERVHGAVARLRASRLFARFGARDLPREGFARVDAELRALGRAAHPASATLILGAWLLEASETWIILRVLGAPVGFLTVLAFDAALSVVRTAAAFAPAGLGVQDLGYLAFFTAAGVPAADAVGPAFLVLKRSKEAFYVALGLVVLFFRRRRAA